MTMPMDLDEERWAQAVRRGARLLFWAALISAVLGNLGAFALPFIGGTREHLKWVALIRAAGGVAIVFAVFWMTTREPRVTIIRHGYRRVVRTLVILDALGRLGTPISLATVDPGSTNYLIVAENIVYPAAALTLFLYINVLTVRFRLHKLAWAACTLAWLFPATSLALPLSSEIFGFVFRPDRPLFYFGIVLDLSVGIWSLQLIRRFSANIASAARGRCLCCGYLLTGLNDCRCSECGTPFSRAWQPEHSGAAQGSAKSQVGQVVDLSERSKQDANAGRWRLAALQAKKKGVKKRFQDDL